MLKPPTQGSSILQARSRARGSRLRSTALLACLLAWATEGPANTPILSLHYQERPPYSRTTEVEVTGLVAGRAAAALRRAGIPFVWKLTPSQRQLALIQAGGGLDCGVGWFKTPERAALGKFSHALYRDKPFAALARPELALPARVSAADLLARENAPLLIKEGYSYGPTLDAIIARAPRAPLTTSSEVSQMVRMLAAGRAQWMIITPEEAQVLLEPPEVARAGLRLVALADMPPGETRHLYCNNAVPDDWLARIDRALR